MAHIEQILHTNLDAHIAQEINYKLASRNRIDIKINDIYAPTKKQYDFRTEDFKAIKISFQREFSGIAIPGDSYMHSYLRQ